MSIGVGSIVKYTSTYLQKIPLDDDLWTRTGIVRSVKALDTHYLLTIYWRAGQHSCDSYARDCDIEEVGETDHV